MAMVTVSARSQGPRIFAQTDFAQSDDEFEQQLQDAVEISSEQFALNLQEAEVVELSTFAYAYALQVSEVLNGMPSEGLGLLQLTASASASASASSGSSSLSFEKREEYLNLHDEEIFMWNGQGHCHGQGLSARGRDTGKNIIVDSGFSILNKDRSTISRSVPVKLCGICFEDSSNMFEGSICFHQFCEPCMTQYIHSRLEQRRHQIYCPHESCREELTLDECRYFLPSEIFEQWSAVMVEAEIPQALKVYCPFSDCIGLLVKESVESWTRRMWKWRNSPSATGCSVRGARFRGMQSYSAPSFRACRPPTKLKQIFCFRSLPRIINGAAVESANRWLNWSMDVITLLAGADMNYVTFVVHHGEMEALTATALGPLLTA